MEVRPYRSAMAAGIAFAVLLLAGFIVFFGATPDTSGSDPAAITSRAVAVLGDSGHRVRTIIGVYLLVLAALALVWFSLGLRQRLRSPDPEQDLVARLISACGILAATSLAIGAALGATLAGNIAFGGEPMPTTAELAWVLPEIGTPMIVLIFPLALAASIVATSVQVLRTGALPRWVGYLGFLGALGGIFAVIFMPLILVFVWALATGIAGVRSGRPEVTRTDLSAAPAM
jgi:hypothetical protein